MGEYWEPTAHLRMTGDGRLQQRWRREVIKWKVYGNKEYRTVTTEEEWRYIPKDTSVLTQLNEL